jgi:divalent metal cation (Fe/Co/Zn/Cd) transporter
MRSAGAQIAAVFLVLLAGISAGVSGVALLVLDTHEPFALTATACGLALVAWVMFHPARVATDPAERNPES